MAAPSGAEGEAPIQVTARLGCNLSHPAVSAQRGVRLPERHCAVIGGHVDGAARTTLLPPQCVAELGDGRHGRLLRFQHTDDRHDPPVAVGHGLFLGEVRRLFDELRMGVEDHVEPFGARRLEPVSVKYAFGEAAARKRRPRRATPKGIAAPRPAQSERSKIAECGSRP